MSDRDVRTMRDDSDEPPAGGCAAHGLAWLLASLVIMVLMAGMVWLCLVLYRLVA